MPFKSLIALKYKNSEGSKTSRKANAIFDDIDDDLAKKWLEKGFIKLADIGDIAEAVAAGEASADMLNASTGEKRSASKAADAKPAGQAAATKASESKAAAKAAAKAAETKAVAEAAAKAPETKLARDADV